jgi:hypothetical protein
MEKTSSQSLSHPAVSGMSYMESKQIQDPFDGVKVLVTAILPA